MYMSCVLGNHVNDTHPGMLNRPLPAPIDPPNHITTEAQRVCGIEETSLSALQHVALVDEVF